MIDFLAQNTFCIINSASNAFCTWVTEKPKHRSEVIITECYLILPSNPCVLWPVQSWVMSGKVHFEVAPYCTCIKKLKQKELVCAAQCVRNLAKHVS